MTRRKEEFIPLHDDKVTFYQCGPTVYWTQHIGNMRAMVMGDLIRRALMYAGYDVSYVRNYTDVGHLTSDADEGEDKMEKGAKREGLTPDQIADKYITQFNDDVKKLNTIPATAAPRATEFISEMVALIAKLIETKHAYKTKHAIYFDVTTYPQYTKLSGQKFDEQEAGEGKGTVSDPQKRHPADFALWFFLEGAHKNALQHWKTEWGDGFPGWHTECVVMSMKYLGETLDVHMGGVEHIPVHHTNEIAQATCVTGKLYVRYWLHNEHLQVNDGKMAKSDGTGITLDDVISRGVHPLSLRYFFLQAQYRSKQNLTDESLEASQRALGNLYNELFLLNQQTEDTGIINQDWDSKFNEAIADDVNIPKALATLWEMLKGDLRPPDKIATALAWDKVFGVQLSHSVVSVPNKIRALIKKRIVARGAKQYEESDRIRAEIEKEGFLVEDKEGKTLVRLHDPLAFFKKTQ